MLITSIFSFPNNVFCPIKDKSKNFSNIFLSSANYFNLVESKILALGKVQSYFIGLLDGFQCIRSFILMVVLSGGRSVGISIFVLLGFLMTGACKYYSKIHSSKKHKILTLSLTSPCFYVSAVQVF